MHDYHIEIRDEVFRTIPMLLEEDWSDTYRFKSRNISIWDRWLYTTGDEDLLNDMSLEDSAKNSAKFLKFHTLLLDKYEVLFAKPSMSDDWKIYKKNSYKTLIYESMDDRPIFIILELELIYFQVGDYTSVVYFTDEKLMSKIDGLVELSGLKYIK